MSSRNRSDRGALVALAMALAAIVLVVYFQQPPKQFDATEYSAQIEKYDNSEVTQLVSNASEFEFFGDTPTQWVMAVFSIAATIISYYAVRLLKSTLDATRDAVKSADDAVDVTKKIGRIQTRAYISVAKIFTDPAQNEGYTGDRFAVMVRVQNFGATPAYDLRVKVESIKDTEKPAFPKFDSGSNGIIGPGVDVSVGTEPFYPQTMVSHGEAKTIDRFVLYYRYRDIFDVTYSGWNMFKIEARDGKPCISQVDSDEKKCPKEDIVAGLS